MSLVQESFASGEPWPAQPCAFVLGGIRWEVRFPQLRSPLESLLAAPDAHLQPGEHLLRDTFLVTLGRAPVRGPGGCGLLLRRTNYGKATARWRDMLRRAGALRAFDNALLFERLGVPTARVLAAGIKRNGLLPQSGYLVVEEIAPSVTLAQWLQQHSPGARGTCQDFGRAIARLHDAGLFHGDLTFNNLLRDAAGRPWFIDLERSRALGRPLTWKEAVQDLHRFARYFAWFNPGARRRALRILSAYCAARGWGKREREFVEAIYHRARHKVTTPPLPEQMPTV